MKAAKQPNFDSIARPYRWLEYLTLGYALQRCRTYFLPRLADRTRALILGDGDGRFLAKFFAANPLLHATAVDTSAAMLALLRRRCERKAAGAHLTLLHADALEHTPAAETDLIVAHFFFDCLSQPELDFLITNLSRHAQPDAVWLISDFRIPEGPMRLPARCFVGLLYLAFRLVTGLQTTRLPNHEEAFRAAGLIQVAQHTSLAGILTTELWQRTWNTKL